MDTVKINSRNKSNIMYAKVDKEDYEKVCLHKWSFSVNKKSKTIKKYPQTVIYENNKRRLIRMHQFIIGKAPKGMYIDHINRDVLDNRKKNLRYVTPRESVLNRRVYKNGKYKYVSKLRITKFGQKYVAITRFGGKSKYLGEGYNEKELFEKLVKPEYKKYYGICPVEEHI